MTDSLDPKLIVINREKRQRREFTVDDLIPSIRNHGIIQPIVVIRDTLELVAGERRLTAALELELTEIPVRFYDTLSELQKLEIEFEENIKRRNLTWQEEAAAAYQLHQMYVQKSDSLHYPKGRDEEVEPKWTIEASAERMNISRRSAGRYIDLGEALEAGDESIAKIDTISAAHSALLRRKERNKAETVQRIMEMATRPKPVAKPTVGSSSNDSTEVASEPAPPAEPEPVPFSIIQADMTQFLAEYSGPKFNFIHLDLPYGVKLQGQAGQAGFEGGGYESSPEIYWHLLDAICTHWGNFMFPNAHIMTWFSFLGNDGEGFYSQTVEYLERRIPGLEFDRNPLVWMKTDNKGILSDANRRARNICEFALMGSTGDRRIVKAVANAYGCPTVKTKDGIHTNEKPVSMLSHFFTMFVDGHTRLIDPTAGSGSAIRVAEQLGAEAAIGLEFNPEFAERAEAKLKQERVLRNISKKATSND